MKYKSNKLNLICPITDIKRTKATFSVYLPDNTCFQSVAFKYYYENLQPQYNCFLSPVNGYSFSNIS